MNNQGLGSWVQRRARMIPWKTAIVFGNQHWTYSEFQNRITRLAYGFRNLGVRRGDRIVYLGQNNPAFLETMFATGTLGAGMFSIS